MAEGTATRWIELFAVSVHVRVSATVEACVVKLVKKLCNQLHVIQKLTLWIERTGTLKLYLKTIDFCGAVDKTVVY